MFGYSSHRRAVFTYLCQAWEIHQSEVKHIWAVYPKMYRQLANALILSGNPERLLFDFLPYFIELREAFVYV